VTAWPAMVTVFVVKTGLCVASGIVAASFFDGGEFVAAAGELVCDTSAARTQAAEATSEIQIVFFMAVCFCGKKMRVYGCGCKLPVPLRQRIPIFQDSLFDLGVKAAYNQFPF
jgi:hypothetical protein